MRTIEEKLIDLGTALLAKEVGFDLITENCFITDYFGVKYDEQRNMHWQQPTPGVWFRPSQRQMQAWLSDVHKIRVFVKQGASGEFNFEIYTWDKPNLIGTWTRIGNISSSETYEDSLELGLLKGLQLLKNDK